MQPGRRQLLTLVPAMATLPLTLRSALAQSTGDFPSRPLRLFVPFGPGSGSDVFARYFGRRLGERLNQGIAVENKPGAGGAVAVQSLKAAPADGYTILLGSNSPMAVNVSAVRALPYDPVADLVPVSGLSRSMAVIVVPARSEIRTVADLVRIGRQKTLNMGTYSAGYQLGVAPLLEKAGFKWDDVPYRGLSQTTADLIGGQIDVAVVDTPGTVAQVNAGQIHAVAVAGASRHPELPDVPTLVESGYPEAIHYSWTSLWLQTGTPQPIVDLLASHMLALLKDADAAKFVASNSAKIMPLGPAEMRAFQKQEIERFARAVRSLGFTPS